MKNNDRLEKILLLLAHELASGEPIDAIPSDILTDLSTILKIEVDSREARSIH
jgi:hypothetical protein